jgi:hypothetical protein
VPCKAFFFRAESRHESFHTWQHKKEDPYSLRCKKKKKKKKKKKEKETRMSLDQTWKTEQLEDTSLFL